MTRVAGRKTECEKQNCVFDQILDQGAVGRKMMFEMTQKRTQRDKKIVLKRKETMNLMDG